jgi:hypothetical protein
MGWIEVNGNVLASATLTPDGRWTPDVLQIAEIVQRIERIPYVDAIDVARRRVARRHRVPVERVAMPRLDGRFQMELRLADADPVMVWVRAA